MNDGWVSSYVTEGVVTPLQAAEHRTDLLFSPFVSSDTSIMYLLPFPWWDFSGLLDSYDENREFWKESVLYSHLPLRYAVQITTCNACTK